MTVYVYARTNLMNTIKLLFQTRGEENIILLLLFSNKTFCSINIFYYLLRNLNNIEPKKICFFVKHTN